MGQQQLKRGMFLFRQYQDHYKTQIRGYCPYIPVPLLIFVLLILAKSCSSQFTAPHVMSSEENKNNDDYISRQELYGVFLFQRDVNNDPFEYDDNYSLSFDRSSPTFINIFFCIGWHNSPFLLLHHYSLFQIGQVCKNGLFGRIV